MQPGSAPSVPLAYYNTGLTSGMNSGTTYSSALSSGASSAQAIANQSVGGSTTHWTVGGLVVGALALIVLFHVLGFRFAFDADVGRRS